MEVSDRSILNMFRLATRSALLGTSVRALASSSVAAQNRSFSADKAVVFNLGGSVIPAMAPVLEKHARWLDMTTEELSNKLFVEGDDALMQKVEPDLRDKCGSRALNLGFLVNAIKSIRGEGMKVGVVNDGRGLNPELLPIEADELFDISMTELNADLPSVLNLDPSNIVYVDNSEEGLAAAAGLGLSTASTAGDIETALKQLEGHLQVPLKEFAFGLSWIYFNKANNPYKSGGDNALYYALAIYFTLLFFQQVYLKVLNIDGQHQH